MDCSWKIWDHFLVFCCRPPPPTHTPTHIHTTHTQELWPFLNVIYHLWYDSILAAYIDGIYGAKYLWTLFISEPAIMPWFPLTAFWRISERKYFPFDSHFAYNIIYLYVWLDNFDQWNCMWHFNLFLEVEKSLIKSTSVFNWKYNKHIGNQIKRVWNQLAVHHSEPLHPYSIICFINISVINDVLQTWLLNWRYFAEDKLYFVAETMGLLTPFSPLLIVFLKAFLKVITAEECLVKDCPSFNHFPNDKF